MPDSSSAANINVDINQIATDLNGKADKDLMNLEINSNFSTSLNNAGIRTVVETYTSGTQWYRIWSDGWCEQGGKITPASSNTITDVNLFIPFADTNYTPMAIAVNDASYNYADKFVSIKATSTTVLTIGERYISGNQICPIKWYACGYIS